MKSLDECLYYLVREMGGLGINAKDIYFTDALAHVEKSGLDGLREIEIDALIMAAERRGLVNELDRVVES